MGSCNSGAVKREGEKVLVVEGDETLSKESRNEKPSNPLKQAPYPPLLLLLSSSFVVAVVSRRQSSTVVRPDSR